MGADASDARGARGVIQAAVEVPAPGGVALHSFRYGDAEEVHEGLRFVYHAEATLHEAIGDALEVVEVVRCAEVEEGDSLYVVVGGT